MVRSDVWEQRGIDNYFRWTKNWEYIISEDANYSKKY